MAGAWAMICHDDDVPCVRLGLGENSFPPKRAVEFNFETRFLPRRGDEFKLCESDRFSFDWSILFRFE